ncbi:MAG: hydroxyacylglutathione hydrolase [Xanthomonadales bacterium]|nr:hydroxyacylglutathione hydrolase [Xanthomonadales bacterium]
MQPISAFSDNYVWLLRGADGACAVVDPGEHEPVLDVLREQGLSLRHILLTHHHHDHIGGVPGLLAHFDAQVIGPPDSRIPTLARAVGEGDTVALPELGLELEVLDVPGHTRSHIVFHGHGLLFCGDTLFSIGCGKLFEGTPAQMQDSLDKLAALPGDTAVYCGHEYTRSNCAFALQVEPGNRALSEVSARANELRNAGKATLPSRMDTELAANPFLRTREDSVVRAATRERGEPVAPGAETLAAIRDWKDQWPG